MTTEKPQRIEGDPEGYEPEFTTGGCSSNGVLCAFYTRQKKCLKVPCIFINRPENRDVYYVKKESSK